MLNLIEKDGYLVAENYKLRDYTNGYYKYLKDKYESPKQQVMNDAINSIRIKIVNGYCEMQNILDIGCGTGSFLKYMFQYGKCFPFGYEIIPHTERWLKKEYIYINPFKKIPDYISGICMWDVLEHLPKHDKLFNNIKAGTYLFVSIPIFKDFKNIKKHKHYVPNEHIWYFTEWGFKDYMKKHNFEVMQDYDLETRAGRDSVMTFVLQKCVGSC